VTSTLIVPPDDARVFEGTQRFIRYAFMPNRLRYCGGDDNRTLFEYAIEGVSDGGLQPLLNQFNGALPYLKLIAHANRIADPFDSRVVEAYWIGNDLLEGVEVRQLYDALLERFGKQLTGRTRDLVLGKAPAGAHPHHSFHVLDVHSRVGEMENTLRTLDGCRVSWAQVQQVAGAELVVQRPPVVLREGQLVLGEPRTERVLRQVEGKGFTDQAQVGDWVSIHWGWVCEVLDQRQRRLLERFTRHHLALANQTI
jgi:hydrogenase maturation factor